MGQEEEIINQIKEVADKMIARTCSPESPFFKYLSNALVNQQILNEIIRASEKKVIPISEKTGNRDYLETMDLLSELKNEAWNIYSMRLEYYYYFEKQGENRYVAEEFYQDKKNKEQMESLQLEIESACQRMMEILYGEERYTATDYRDLADEMQIILEKIKTQDSKMLKEFEVFFRNLLIERDKMERLQKESVGGRTNPLHDIDSSEAKFHQDGGEIPIQRRENTFYENSSRKEKVLETYGDISSPKRERYSRTSTQDTSLDLAGRQRTSKNLVNNFSENLLGRESHSQRHVRRAQDLRLRTSPRSPNQKEDLIRKKATKDRQKNKKNKKLWIAGLASLLLIGGIVYSVNGDKNLEVTSVPESYSFNSYMEQEEIVLSSDVIIQSDSMQQPVNKVAQDHLQMEQQVMNLDGNTQEDLRKKEIARKIEGLDDELVSQLVNAIEIVNNDIPYDWRWMRIEPNCEDNREFLLEALCTIDERISAPNYTKGREGYNVACHLRRMTERMLDYKVSKGFDVPAESVKYVYSYDAYGTAQKCDIMAKGKLIGRSTTTKNKIPQDFKKAILQYGTVDKDIRDTSFGFDESGRLTEDTKVLYDMFRNILDKEYEVPGKALER